MVLHAMGQRFSCSLWRRPWCLSPAAHEGVHPRAGRYVLKEAVACDKPIQEQASGRNIGPLGPNLKQSVPKGLHPREGPMLEQLVKDCILWKGPHVGKGEQCDVGVHSLDMVFKLSWICNKLVSSL